MGSQVEYETKWGFYSEATGTNDVPLKPAKIKSCPSALSQDGPKVSVLISPEPSDEELIYVQQLGASHVFTWITDHKEAKIQQTAEFLSSLCDKVSKHGLVLDSVGHLPLAKNPNIILGKENRDELIAEFCEFIANLNKAKIPLTVFTWEPTGKVWSTGSALLRGGGVGRMFDANLVTERMECPPTEEHLWETMKYFLDKVLPVCKEQQVRLALHPNDPPLPEIAGVPNIIRSQSAYERVFEIGGDSPWLGMEFCCGCWLEGGENFGNLMECLRDFSKRGKIFKVHLRNVSDTVPCFTECYLDEGYGNIPAILSILVETDYPNTVILDHSPPFINDTSGAAATAFCVGYMKGCIRTAQQLTKLAADK
eukprot:m.74366 g.74366  ORF g.74366 m.74366 type:complete len:367 (-) comp12454_c0_seq3:98-1198(-)